MSGINQYFKIMYSRKLLFYISISEQAISNKINCLQEYHISFSS